MKSVEDMEYCKDSEKLVKILMGKTQNNNPLFFRVQAAYYFAKIASSMRTNIETHDRGIIPVSLYALNLSVSGSGKGLSTNIIEEHVLDKFKREFIDNTFPSIAAQNLAKIAVKRADKEDKDPDEMQEKVEKEFEQLGQLAFSFDSGTSPAVKQMRHKLLMANAGAVSLEIDEIGSNLLSNIEVLNTFLELYDVGKVKQKLIKNTADNMRNKEIDGKTPTNMLLYGTPSKLLDGSKVESEFYSFLETGYARRCLFGYIKKHTKDLELTPEEVYDLLTDKSNIAFLEDLSKRLGALADIINFNSTLTMTKQVSLLLIEYKLNCEKLADTLGDYAEIEKAELSHRYFKALKLAGAYAFIEGNYEITEDNLYAAIKLVEESGKAFKSILTREKPYIKLAKYISSIGSPVTQVDLLEALPFYKGSEPQKRDLMSLAIAYGYKNNIVIKKSYIEGIEFLEGESMKVTDIGNLLISYSNDITTGFKADRAPFDQLHRVTTSNLHYTAHHFKEEYRTSVNAIQGFNLLILDVDEGVSLETAKLLLKGFKALFSTTKRHTNEANRFRVILPLTHEVKLTPSNYKEFMSNVFDWLPFKVDEQTTDIARKWEGCTGASYEYIDGDLIDAMLFIPQTKKAEEQAKKVMDSQSLSNLERWFVNNSGAGNRSNQLIKYAFILVDSNYTFDSIKNAVHTLNNKLVDKLPEEELNNTILVSVMRKISQRDSN